MKILLGMQDSDGVKSFRSQLSNRLGDIEAVEIAQHSKMSLIKRDICNGFDVLIIQQHMEAGHPVGYGFLDEITDQAPDVKIIPILDPMMGGTEEIQKLFGLGIYNIVFSGDTQLDTFVRIITKGRTKAEAKAYYKINFLDEIITEHGEKFDEESVKKNIERLRKSKDIKKDYDSIISGYTSKEKLYFISSLPKDVEALLSQSANGGVEVEDSGVVVGNKTQEVILKTVQQEVFTTDMPMDYKKTIAVISMEKGMGATTIASEMASWFSKNKIKTSLIDGDFKYMECYYRFPLGSEGINLISALRDSSHRDTSGEDLDKYLTVYSDNAINGNGWLSDDLSPRVSEILRVAKDKSQAVIVDVSYDSNRIKEIERIISWVDHIVLIVNQNPAPIFRIGDNCKIFNNRSVDFAISGFNNKVKALNEKQIGSLLSQLGVNFNRSFTVPFSPKVHEAMAYRSTVVDRYSEDEFTSSIELICNYYYRVRKKKGLFGRKRR